MMLYLIVRIKLVDWLFCFQITNYKEKCENHETTISKIKKCLQVDKLETEFENYKRAAMTKITFLEETKSQLLNDKKNLQVMKYYLSWIRV